jgi:hypothetical protein
MALLDYAAAAFELMKRQDGSESDQPPAGEKEIFSSWALFILIVLLIVALFTSYMLQQKKVQAVHETVISIFAGRHFQDGAAAFLISSPFFSNPTRFKRYGRWPRYSSHVGQFHSGTCQLQLSDLL